MSELKFTYKVIRGTDQKFYIEVRGTAAPLDRTWDEHEAPWASFDTEQEAIEAYIRYTELSLKSVRERIVELEKDLGDLEELKASL